MANTARCWSYLTGLVLGQKLPSEIPDHEVGPNNIYLPSQFPSTGTFAYVNLLYFCNH